MSGLIAGFPHDGVVTVNRVILKDEYTIDDLQERVATLCENVKTYHSDTGLSKGSSTLPSMVMVTSWSADLASTNISFWEAAPPPGRLTLYSGMIRMGSMRLKVAEPEFWNAFWIEAGKPLASCQQ